MNNGSDNNERGACSLISHFFVASSSYYTKLRRQGYLHINGGILHCVNSGMGPPMGIWSGVMSNAVISSSPPPSSSQLMIFSRTSSSGPGYLMCDSRRRLYTTKTRTNTELREEKNFIRKFYRKTHEKLSLGKNSFLFLSRL